MKQNASCRRMRLSDSDYRLLHLAGPGLEALNCDLATCEIWQVGQMLRGFPGLTCLELHEGYMLAGYAFRIRKLPLQELVLCGCDKLQLELHLFSESALTSLRKLHIEEGAKRQRSYLAEPEPHRLAECGSILRNLPHLHQISSSCALLGMRDVLATWHHQVYPKGLMTTDGCDCDGLSLWTKPEGN